MAMTKSERSLSLSVGSLINAIRYLRYASSMFSFGRTYGIPKLERVEGGRGIRVLVISPHEDDEVIGCGGTLRKYVESGSQIRVVYFSDGSRGINDRSPEEAIQKRRAEARNGLAVLGIDDMIFLGYQDGELRPTRSSIGAFSKVISDYQPQVIFTPFFLDNHPDHVVSTRIVGAALRNYPKDLTCYSYEVWSTLPPNVIHDITEVMGVKLRALQEHQSQTSGSELCARISGLNSFRSMYAASGISYCEGFVKQSKKEFIRMMAKY
jgi:N-acetylglucosamine malate deacetylase 1